MKLDAYAIRTWKSNIRMQTTIKSCISMRIETCKSCGYEFLECSLRYDTENKINRKPINLRTMCSINRNCTKCSLLQNINIFHCTMQFPTGLITLERKNKMGATDAQHISLKLRLSDNYRSIINSIAFK